MRTFVAFEIPEKAKADIFQIITSLQAFNIRNINWVPKENLHITLQFLGDIKEQDIQGICNILSDEVSYIHTFNCSKPQLEFIPANDPRIIWIHFYISSTDIFKSSIKLKRKLETYGLKLDKRRLKFHVTVGRIKKRLPDYFIQNVLSDKFSVNDFKISEIVLYQSLLRLEGPVYSVVEKFKLKNHKN